MGKKSKPGGGNDQRGNSQLLLLGVVLWVVAWFVPVYRGQELFGGLGTLTREFGSSPEAVSAVLQGPDWLPGWPACAFAWQLLVDDQPQGGDRQWKQRVAGASCLTNVVMLAGLVFALARRRNVVLGSLLIACVGVNSSWIWLSDQNPFEWLRAGYFLWLASFVLVGLGLCMRPRA